MKRAVRTAVIFDVDLVIVMLISWRGIAVLFPLRVYGVVGDVYILYSAPICTAKITDHLFLASIHSICGRNATRCYENSCNGDLYAGAPKKESHQVSSWQVFSVTTRSTV